jgi:hypothetical protein
MTREAPIAADEISEKNFAARCGQMVIVAVVPATRLLAPRRRQI